MEIYKINQISLNQTATQFCLAYNKGIKTFRTNDYQPITSTNTIGNITCVVLLYELNIVIFTGSESNQYYHNKKLVIYDTTKHVEIYSTLFKEPITSIFAENKYIFVISSKDINVFNLTSLHKIQFVLQIETNPFQSTSSPFIPVSIWSKTQNSIITYYIAFQEHNLKGRITIQSYYDTNFTLDKTTSVSYAYNSLQNIYYVPQYDLIFLVDRSGSYLTSYAGDTMLKEQEFYRGTTKGIITSIVALSNNYIAMSNRDKTIHIYQIGKKNAKTITTLLYKFINSNMVSSTMKIRLSEIANDEDDDHLYDSFFKQRGVILVYNQDISELNCLCYNGYAYKIKLNMFILSHEISQKVKWCNSEGDTTSNTITNDTADKRNSGTDAIDNDKDKDNDQWKII